MKKEVLFAISLLISVQLLGQLPYQNPGLSSEERAKDLISRLTLEEKAVLMCDQSRPDPTSGDKTVQLVE